VKILVVQIGRIGDMMLLTPMLRALHRYNNAVVDVLAGRLNAPLLEGHPYVRGVFAYDKRPASVMKLIAALRRERYDWWIDPKDHFSREGSLLVRMAAARASIGYNRPGTKIFDIGLASDEANLHLHVTERNLRALVPLGIPQPDVLLDAEKNCPLANDPFRAVIRREALVRTANDACAQRKRILDVLRPELPVRAEILAFVREQVKAGEKPLLAVNISASQPSRLWPVERWTEFLHPLTDEWQVVVSAQPSDSDTVRQLSVALSDVQLFSSRSINDVVALTSIADMVVTPDTAVVHSAAAFDKPVVALYPRIYANYLKFRPLSSCVASVLPPEGYEEVQHIEVARVADAMQSLLRRMHSR
jgi:ADP-heptose:LPS heptosyltransferase